MASKASTIGYVAGAGPPSYDAPDGLGEVAEPVLGHRVGSRGWERPADEGLVDGHAPTLSPRVALLALAGCTDARRPGPGDRDEDRCRRRAAAP